MLTLENLLLPKLSAENDNIKTQFITAFRNLYRLPILHPTANLILTVVQQQRAEFVISVLRKYDTLAGLCQSTGGGLFGLFGKKKSSDFQYKIGIKRPQSDVIVHEITHALERESGVDLNADFRKAIGTDLKDRRPENFAIRTAVDSVMKQELLSYEKSHIMSELQARYFQLLATSRELGKYSQYAFNFQNITDFFVHTTQWLTEVYNPLLESKISPEIRQLGDNIAEEISTENVNKFADNTVTSIYGQQKRSNSVGKWSNAFGSNMDFYKGFQQVGMLEGQQTLDNKQSSTIALEDLQHQDDKH